MLDVVTTNLFDARAQTLVNPVNIVGVMGAGLAAEFKRRYPSMFAAYRQHCASGRLEIGKLHLWRGPSRWILNFPTKKHWRDPSQLEYIRLGLQKLRETYEARGITSLAFPQLGCGNGGLDWGDVREVMARHLADLPIPITVSIVE